MCNWPIYILFFLFESRSRHQKGNLVSWLTCVKEMWKQPYLLKYFILLEPEIRFIRYWRILSKIFYGRSIQLSSLHSTFWTEPCSHWICQYSLVAMLRPCDVFLYPTAMALFSAVNLLCWTLYWAIERRASARYYATPFPQDETLPAIQSISFLMNSAFISDVETFENCFLISVQIQVLRCLDSNPKWNNKSMFIFTLALHSSA